METPFELDLCTRDTIGKLGLGLVYPLFDFENDTPSCHFSLGP